MIIEALKIAGLTFSLILLGNELKTALPLAVVIWFLGGIKEELMWNVIKLESGAYLSVQGSTNRVVYCTGTYEKCQMWVEKKTGQNLVP